MADNTTLQPQHLDFANVGSNSTHTSFRSGLQNNNKGFWSFHNIGSNSTHASFNLSGYQYILATNTVCSISEPAHLTDSVTVVNRQTITEGFVLPVEGVTTNHPQVDDRSHLTDSVTVINRQTLTEGLLISEGVSAQSFTSTLDKSKLTDFVTITNHQTISENRVLKESISVQWRIQPRFTVRINGKSYYHKQFTAKVGKKIHLKSNYTVVIHGKQNLLAGVTATGTGPLGDANPIGPNVSVLGTSLIGSNPPPTAATDVFIELANTATTNVNWFDMWSFGSTLNFAGGTWHVETKRPVSMGNRGDIVSVWGLKAVITDVGRETSNNMKASLFSGTFGSPRMNKQFRFITGASALSRTLQQAVINNKSTNQVLTAKTIAFMVANLVGIKLTWLAQDYPVDNFALEQNMTGSSALNSLAQRAGATLRSFGNDNYYVAYPNQTIGSFIVPDQHLLNGNGLVDGGHEDLETGIGGAVNLNSYGTPSISLQAYPLDWYADSTAQNGQSQLPPGQPNSGYPSPLYPVGMLGKKLTSDDPPSVYQLPPDYNEIMLQILIGNGYSLSTARYITKDSTVFDTFVDPGILNGGPPVLDKNGAVITDYIYQVYEGGAYVPKFKVDHKVFPSHPAIDAGNFTMNIVCTRRSLLGTDNNNKNALLPPSFVQVYKGTINCVFFGVMPLPGMFCSATADDQTVSGLLEQVSYTSPGNLQLDVSQWVRIDWLNVGLNYKLG